MAAGRQTLLSAVGLLGSVPAAMLPWLLLDTIVPLYQGAGAPLPQLTGLWLRFWPVSLLLPVLLALLWWRLAGHPQRGTLTATASLVGALLVDGASVVVLWLPILGLAELAG